ncbi:hypothetical protein Hanom_Chr05g00410601 [Helianthus anomalus]
MFIIIIIIIIIVKIYLSLIRYLGEQPRTLVYIDGKGLCNLCKVFSIKSTNGKVKAYSPISPLVIIL